MLRRATRAAIDTLGSDHAARLVPIRITMQVRLVPRAGPVLPPWKATSLQAQRSGQRLDRLSKVSPVPFVPPDRLGSHLSGARMQPDDRPDERPSLEDRGHRALFAIRYVPALPPSVA